MDDEPRADDVVSGLRRLGEARDLLTAELRRVADMLVAMLARGGTLDDAQAAAMAARFPAERGPRVELDEVADKRAIVRAEVDCAARMHLCHGRCCGLDVKLSRQDVEEGRLAFWIDRPYLRELRRELAALDRGPGKSHPPALRARITAWARCVASITGRWPGRLTP